jgi:Tfp pilus assembly protein PilN
MFTIDLLNGQGIPPKTTPGAFVILAFTAVVPIAAAIGMFGMYTNNSEALSLREKEIADYDMEISQYSGDVKTKKSLEKEKLAFGKYLTEVKSSLGKHTQWSPVLTTLIENIPDSVILTSLEIEHDTVRKSVPKKDNPKKKVEIVVPIRILKVGIDGGNPEDSDQAVQDFMGRLWASDTLGPKLENIGHSQESKVVEGKDVISYQINCFFKPGI